MNTQSFTKQQLLLENNPFLAIMYRNKKCGGGVLESIYFKTEIICHGGFIDSGRKDVVSCSRELVTNIY